MFVPLALLILTGETPQSLFLALAGRRLLQFRHSDQVFSPTHKQTEGRAPVWGSEFTSKDAVLQVGIQQKPLLG